MEFHITVTKTSATKSKESESGKLRIGDDWNAIRIIALSQSNPLKAIAELVENSIDASPTALMRLSAQRSSMRAAYRATLLNGLAGNCGARDSMLSAT